MQALSHAIIIIFFGIPMHTPVTIYIIACMEMVCQKMHCVCAEKWCMYLQNNYTDV